MRERITTQKYNSLDISGQPEDLQSQRGKWQVPMFKLQQQNSHSRGFKWFKKLVIYMAILLHSSNSLILNVSTLISQKWALATLWRLARKCVVMGRSLSLQHKICLPFILLSGNRNILVRQLWLWKSLNHFTFWVALLYWEHYISDYLASCRV